MASSNMGESGGVGPRYRTKSCNYRKNAEIKVSKTNKNSGKLFYTCRDGNCSFFGWCKPINGDGHGSEELYKMCKI